jgi:elongation factor Ts
VARAALAGNPADVDALGRQAIDGGASIEETRRALIARIGENIGVRRFEIVTTGGVLGTYLHGNRIGSLVTLAGGDESLARDLAMHVAAINPQYVTPEQVPAELVERERGIYAAQVEADPKAQGKPAEIVAKMIDGKLRKFLAEITLVGQPFVKDDKQTVGEVLKKAGAKVERFVRYEVGAGIEKKQENFAEEVMAQVRGA